MPSHIIERCPIVHVALRLGSPDTTSTSTDVIEAHNAVARRGKSVYLGKLGRPLKGKSRELLETSIRQRNSSYLFLVRKNDLGLSVFKAALVRLLPVGQQPPRDSVPAYYATLFGINTWFQVGILEPVDRSKLDDLRLVTNGNSLRRALETSRTTMMLAEPLTPGSPSARRRKVKSNEGG